MLRKTIYVSLWITTILLLATKDADGQILDFGVMVQNFLNAATGGAVSPQKGGNSPFNPDTIMGATNGVITNLLGSSLPNLFQALQNLFMKVITTGSTNILTILNAVTSGIFSRSCGPNGFSLGTFLNTLTSGLLGGPDNVNVNSVSLSDLMGGSGPIPNPDLAAFLATLPGGTGGLMNAATTALANLLAAGYRPGSTSNTGDASVTGTGAGSKAAQP